jgi:hypothetical protein
MEESKIHFEQIAVETVRKIATEFPASSAIENDGLSFETQDEVSVSHTDLRQLAQQLQQEHDPAVFNKLVVQMHNLLESKLQKSHTKSH